MVEEPRVGVRGGMKDAERKATASAHVTSQQPRVASCKWSITVVSFTSVNVYARIEPRCCVCFETNDREELWKLFADCIGFIQRPLLTFQCTFNFAEDVCL